MNQSRLSPVFLLPALPLFAWVAAGGAAVPVDDAAIRKVESRFVAPCCWQESVEVHQSQIAAQMRDEISGMMRQGKSEDEIVAFYVARYGERILWAPRGRRYFWLIVMPVVVLAIGSLLLAYYLARLRRSKPVAASTAGLPPIPDEDLDF